jgi:hypothetical protein
LSFIKYKSRQYYVVLLGFTLIASVCGDLISHFLRGIANPNYGSSGYQIVVFPIISSIYYHAIDRKHKFFFTLIAILYIAFGLLNMLLIQKSSINSYTLIIKSIILICYSIYYFYWLIRELPTAQLHRLPMFWINSAYIIYFSGNLFLFVFTSYLVNVLNNDLLVYWTLHNVLGIIEGLMIIVALWMDLRNIKSHS